MTFTQIVATVTSHCNLGGSPEAVARVGASINRHYKRVTSTLGLDPTRFVTRSVSMTLGVRTVTFTEIEKIDRVIDTTDATAINPLTPVSQDTQRTTQPGTSAPTTWALQSATASTMTVLTDTIPQSAYSLQADGWATLADLAGSDEPAIPESFHDILTFSVIAEELLKKEKPALAREFASGDEERPGRAENLLKQLRFHLADNVVDHRQASSARASAVGGSGGGGGTVGGTAYTQTALLTFDLGSGIAPFAVAQANAAVVTNLDADKLDGQHGSYYLDRANHTGAIASTALTLAASDRLIGRDTASGGASEEISVTGGIEFTGSQSIRTTAFTGDVTKSAGGTALTIANDAVTYAKMQDVSATARILGRKTASAGDPEECTLSEILDFIGSAAQGDILYRGAATWTRLAAGTSGQFLQTLGAGANPAWENAGALNRDVTVTTVANTAVETTVYSFAVPGGTLGSTRMLRLTLHGDQLQNFAGSDTLTIRVKYGATTIYSAGIAVGQDAARRAIRVVSELSGFNATNAQHAFTNLMLGGLTTTAGAGAATTTHSSASHATVAEDSTASKNLVVTVQQQNADANISFRCNVVQLELL